ncbi:MAG TPA: hypothetical protein VF862_03985 [Gemmatimonadales bacterium]
MGSRNEESTRLLGKKTPTHFQGFLQKSPRLADYRGGAEEELSEADDAPNQQKGLEVKRLSGGEDGVSWGVDHRGMAFPHIKSRKELIKGRAQCELG